MRRRDARAWLFDISDAGQYILEITAGKEFDAFVSDRALRQLVERNLELIGEAVASLLRSGSPIADRIGHTRQIVGLRNRLVHAYFDIDPTAIWTIVRQELPNLLEEVAQLLQEHPGEDVGT